MIILQGRISLIFAIAISSFIQLNGSWSIADKKGESVMYEWINGGDLIGEEEVFINAFSEAYRDLYLDVDNKYELLKNAFEDERNELNNDSKNIYCISAKKDNKVVGYASFEEGDNPYEVYIRQMAVDPSCWSRGIGRNIVFAILDKLPDTKKIVLITRSTNNIACTFYRTLGFKNSEYMHEGYDPNVYQGFEYSIESSS